MSDATHGGKGDRDRTSNKEAFWENYEKVFGKRDARVQTLEEPLTQVQIDRKLREWGMMYDCLQNIQNYEAPLEEVTELLKQIKIS